MASQNQLAVKVLSEVIDTDQLLKEIIGKAPEPEDLVYRRGNMKFGVATIVPPSSGSQNWFTLMSYTSREDKSLRLPFSLSCKYQRRSRGQSQSNGKQQIFDF